MMERVERGFFGKLLVFIFAVLAFIGLVAMVLSVGNAYINPQHFIWTTVFGLAFWEILIYNVVILFFLLTLRSRKAWLVWCVSKLQIFCVVKSSQVSSGKQRDKNVLKFLQKKLVFNMFTITKKATMAVM